MPVATGSDEHDEDESDDAKARLTATALVWMLLLNWYGWIPGDVYSELNDER